MNTPLNTAHLRNPGKISTLEHLHGLVSQGQHVPIWVARPLAAKILAQHGHNNAAVAHPGVPIPLPPAQVGQPNQQQPPQRVAVGGVVPPPNLGPTQSQLHGAGGYGQPNPSGMPGEGMVQNAQSPPFQIPQPPHPGPIFLGPPVGANARGGGLGGLQIGGGNAPGKFAVGGVVPKSSKK